MTANMWASVLIPAFFLLILWVLWKMAAWVLGRIFPLVIEFYHGPANSVVHWVLRILCIPTLGVLWVLGGIYLIFCPAYSAYWTARQVRDWWHR